MIRGKPNALVVEEHAGPVLFCVVEEVLYGFFELRRRIAVTKTQERVPAPMVEHLVVKFGEDQLEHLFEHVHARVRENLVLHFDDQITQ